MFGMMKLEAREQRSVVLYEELSYLIRKKKKEMAYSSYMQYLRKYIFSIYFLYLYHYMTSLISAETLLA